MSPPKFQPPRPLGARSIAFARFVLFLVLIAGVVGVMPATAQNAARPEAEDLTKELQTLIANAQAHLRSGSRNPAEFTRYLSELKVLRKKINEPGSERDGFILLTQARICIDALEDCAQARVYAEEFQAHTDNALVQSVLAEIELCEAQYKLRQQLVGQPAPPLKFVWSSEKGLTSLEQLAGKVVVLDFWSNISPQSVGMFPMMRRLQERFEHLDVEVVGVSCPAGIIVGLKNEPLDFRGAPKKEMQQMGRYRKVQRITWTLAMVDSMAGIGTYAVSKYPIMVIVAPDGRVRHSGIDESVAFLTRVEWIDRVLHEFGKPTSGFVK